MMKKEIRATYDCNIRHCNQHGNKTVWFKYSSLHCSSVFPAKPGAKYAPVRHVFGLYLPSLLHLLYN